MGKLKEKIPLPARELTRKEFRKEQRQLKKIGRSRFIETKLKKRKEILGKKNKNVKSNMSVDPVNHEIPQQSSKITCSVPKKKKERSPVLNTQRKNHDNLLDKMKMQRKRQLAEANKDEDKEIKFLEKKLKLATKKSVSSSKAFVESGLDYILDVCDSEKVHSTLKSEVNFDDYDSDFNDDILLVRNGKTQEKASVFYENKNVRPATLSGNEVNYSAINETTEESEDSSSVTTEISNPNVKDSEHSDFQEDDSLNDIRENIDQPVNKFTIGNDGEKELNVASSTKPKIWEDIYGRLRDQEGNILKQNDYKYIPPALRNSEGSDDDKKRKELIRKVKGLLNRLALNNMHSIANQIEDLYSRNSRHSMNQTIFSLYVDSLITPVLSPERLIIDHAMLIAVLNANIGSEIGAFMLQNFVQKFDSLFLYSQAVENKTLDNLIYLISYLYCFKLFESILMYDILNKLATQLSEKNVDLILIILKSVGFSLRKDNPLAMKSFLLNIQRQMSITSSGIEDNSRMRYMLDILLSIKNNNISKLADFDPEHHEHLKKVLKSAVRNGISNESLRIGLEDLLKAEERGRWWIVGSAWNKDEGEILKSKRDILPSEQFSAQLLALAKKQKMNTDNRRNIFCILMSAEDYHDAFEKVLKLGLKGQQEREIPFVMIHCLLQENNYNPYYAHIADQLCISNRRHQMALQCALWDRFRALDKLSMTQINYLAKFLSQLILAGSIPISVLKVVEFTELDKPLIRLLRQTILSIANIEGKDSLDHIFQKVGKSKKLSLFKEALRLFVHHFILRNMPNGELKDRISLISTLLAGVVD